MGIPSHETDGGPGGRTARPCRPGSAAPSSSTAAGPPSGRARTPAPHPPAAGVPAAPPATGGRFSEVTAVRRPFFAFTLGPRAVNTRDGKTVAK